jgi:hypothetical protein
MTIRLALLSCAIAVSGYAQSPGAFTPTGSMITPRYLHTATLLADGRVLIAGGEMLVDGTSGMFKTLSNAEIYDPATGTFTATGNMTAPRAYHTATLLPNGKVLIAGGEQINYPTGGVAEPTLASAELYDPDTGTFSATGTLTTSRASHTATLLSNGTVLIAGGLQSPSGVYVASAVAFLASAEIYDPSTGIFTATGNMTSVWADTATLLANGKVLITRDDLVTPLYVSSADLYDPLIGTFTSAGFLNANHTMPTATLVTNGKVLIAGGDMGDGDGATVIAELYDPATGAFSSTGSLTVGREEDTATLLSDGSVLFAGGHNDLAASAEIYGPLAAAFSGTASMPTARELHTATLLRDGRVLIAGGDDERYWIPETILSSAELYTPAVLVPAPALFSLTGDGQGQGAIWHADTGQIASSQTPAAAGDALAMYTTSLFEGGIVPPQVVIGGKVAEILFFGDAPGYPGYFQVNFRVPGGVAPGSAVTVRLTYLGRPSNAVAIGVQ